MSDSVWPHRQQPIRLPCPWDSPGKNTGVGCHFLLQCMKVKSESEVAQSCPNLSNPMDCSPPGPSIHGIFQARVLEWVAIAFSNLLYICTLKYIYLSLDAQLVFFLELLVLFSPTLLYSCFRDTAPISFIQLLNLIFYFSNLRTFFLIYYGNYTFNI